MANTGSWYTLLPGSQNLEFCIISNSPYRQTFVQFSFANTFSNIFKRGLKHKQDCQKKWKFYGLSSRKWSRMMLIFDAHARVIHQNVAYSISINMIYYKMHLLKGFLNDMLRYVYKGGCVHLCTFVLKFGTFCSKFVQWWVILKLTHIGLSDGAFKIGGYLWAKNDPYSHWPFGRNPPTYFFVTLLMG